MSLGETCVAEIRHYLESVVRGVLNESDYAAIRAIIDLQYSSVNNCAAAGGSPFALDFCSKEKPVVKSRALFEALAVATGVKLTELTKSQRGRINAALAEIIVATPNVTPEEIHRRARAYKKAHYQWDLTPTSLCSHWSEFSVDLEAKTAAAKRDVYQKEPAGWLKAAEKAFPGIDFSGRKWEDLSVSIRADILKFIP